MVFCVIQCVLVYYSHKIFSVAKYIQTEQLHCFLRQQIFQAYVMLSLIEPHN